MHLVFVNMKATPFHVAIPPIRPAIYFYDTEGNPIAAESVVDGSPAPWKWIPGARDLPHRCRCFLCYDRGGEAAAPEAALELCAFRRREFPSGGQRADVLAHRPGVPPPIRPTSRGRCCDAVGEGLFSAVALEMDPGTRMAPPCRSGAVNVSTQRSRPRRWTCPISCGHAPPIRPASLLSTTPQGNARRLSPPKRRVGVNPSLASGKAR